MVKLLVCFAVFFTAPLPLGAQVPTDFPQRIDIRTPTQTFTETRYLVLREGRIWVKPNPFAGLKGDWELLGGTGLPRNPDDKDFVPPLRIVEISCEMDLDHLIAVADTGVIYDLEGFRGSWKDSWGLPSTHLMKVPAHQALAISRRGPGSTLTDIAGHVHKEGDGVTSFYLLDPDGLTIRYGDAWLPDFNNAIFTPHRGRFQAASLAASGSLIFIMDKGGQMYTRLADFDTEGCDPLFFLTYTYDLHSPWWQRVLPGEDWVAQPRVQGRLTGRITVVQTGPGSRERELRVEGCDPQGRGGYFVKPAYAGPWTFVATGASLKPTIDGGGADLGLGPSRDKTLKGTMTVRWLWGKEEFPVTLSPFNIDCSPATLTFTLDKEVCTCRLFIRHFYFQGLYLVALEVPPGWKTSGNSRLRALARFGLGGMAYFPLQWEQRDGRMVIRNTFGQTVILLG